MIHVLASIHVKEGKQAQALAAIHGNLATVRAEAGCIQYTPAVDIDTGMPAQETDDSIITMIETWKDLSALKAHSTAPHMLTYRESVKDLVEKVTLKVLEDA
ncbi:MAG TPA: antibiotic biosynthesis monooxygenase [Gammaproteobacteria bacterium]|nr:antibiotic biosynthesis monooxygenase [Gammaproteobacteria bacterium]